MKASTQALALIRQFEGLRTHPYLCPGGYTTIGYGHVIHPSKTKMALTPQEAEALLQQDIAKVLKALERLIVVPLAQYQIDALISFTFNIGAGALQRSRLRQCVNRGEHSLAAAEFLKWVRAGGRILAGLVKRRQLEAKLYQGGAISFPPSKITDASHLHFQ